MSARPGSANHDDSPVSHNDTGTPAATAVAATVNAWAHRSGASVPAVTFTTSVRVMAARVPPEEWCPNDASTAPVDSGTVLEVVFTTILALTTVAAGAMGLLVVLKLFKGQA